MDNTSKKTLALLTIIAAYYLTLFDWDLPAFSQFKLYWPYMIGVAIAIAWNMADRFLKHAITPDYERKKLLKTHLFLFIILVPAAVFINLPALGPPIGIWKTDYKLAFLVSYFFVTAGPKIVTNYERLLTLITSTKNKEGDK